MILEIGKSYVRKFYGGNVNAAIKEKDGLLWTEERIKGAFKLGHGTKKDLENYIANNKQFAYFVEV